MAKFTPRQGQFLAYIDLYWRLHHQGPSEMDMAQYFEVTPPSAHLMIVKLDQLGLITRQSGVARSVRVAIPREEIPELAGAEPGARKKPEKPDQGTALRQHLLDLLHGGGAHLDFEAAIADLAPDLRGARPAGVPHSPWRLLEHMRIAQWDILEFSRNPGHVSPPFPDGYWPDGDAPPDAAAWDRSVTAFREDLQAMHDLVADPATDLFAPILHGEGQTILREALLVADHNAYHLGQLVVVRRALGAWPADR